MKTLLILFILTVTSSMSFAQIEVKETFKPVEIGNVKNGAYTQAAITYVVENDDTLYSFIFLDQRYKTLTEYKAVTFSGGYEVVSQLYGIMKSFFTDENKKNKDYNQVIQLGSKEIRMYNFRNLGTTSVAIHMDRGYCYLTEKQVEKLFGK